MFRDSHVRFFLILVMPMNGSDSLLMMVSNGQNVRQLDANVEHRIHSVLVRLIETIIGDYFPVLDVELCKQTALAWLGISRGIMKLAEPPHHLSEPMIRA